MITITRHPVDHDFAVKQVATLAVREKTQTERARHNFNQLHMAHTWALMHASYRSVLDPKGSSIEFWDSIVLAARTGTAVFAIAAPEGLGVDLEIGGKVHLPAEGSTLQVNPVNWTIAYNLAVVCRDKKLLDILCSTSTTTLRRGSSFADEFMYLWVDVLRSYWHRESDVLTKLNTAVEATGVEKPAMGKALLLQHYYPTMKLFYHLAQQDADGVNSGLEEALKLHKKYWGQKSRANTSDGLLALGPMAVACIAYDFGIKLTVESEYMPQVLIEGLRVGE